MTTTEELSGPAPAADKTSDVLLEVENLVLRYPVRNGTLEAVSDVSFTVRRGETLGLVGESGCGKSSTGRAVMHMPPPTEGTVKLDGQVLTGLSPAELREARRRMQLIFQDPVSALNPRRRVREIVGEGLAIAGESRSAITEKVTRILELIGMDIDIVGGRRPHELSGGQCQRIAIARALILRPEIIIFDEAVSALDVSIRAQILRLILDLQQKFGLAYIFISHDLSVVKRICDRIAVMYLGRIVEIGPSDVVCDQPRHPYTKALLSAIPIADPRQMRVEKLGLIEGDSVTIARSDGCAFEARCPHRFAPCGRQVPPLIDIGGGQRAACFLNEPDRQQGDARP